jgi:hypothetical protein
MDFSFCILRLSPLKLLLKNQRATESKLGRNIGRKFKKYKERKIGKFRDEVDAIIPSLGTPEELGTKGGW